MKLVIRYLLLLVLLVVGPAKANFAIFQVASNPVPVCALSKNIVINYSADNTGLINARPSFENFNTDVLAWQIGNTGTVCLTVPSGTYLFGGSGITTSSKWTNEIKDLFVSAYGATFRDYVPLITNATTAAGNNVLHFSSIPAGIVVDQVVSDTTSSVIPNGTTVSSIDSGAGTVTLSANVTGGGVGNGDSISFTGSGTFFGGTFALINDNTHYINLQTVSAGSGIVTLTSTTNCSALFHTGDWALVTGLDQQGNGGYPTNPHWFEWVQLSNVDCATGIFTLSAPLAFSYDATWPNYDAGSAFSIYQGGPATIYAVNQGWKTTQEYRGLTINQSGQLGNGGYSITFRDCMVLGAAITPSTNYSLLVDNCDTSGSGTVEVDKLWSQVTVSGGQSHGWNFQSAAAGSGNFTFSNHHVRDVLTGMPYKLTVTNGSQIDPGIDAGSTSYGVAFELDCLNSTILSGVLTRGVAEQLATDGSSMSGGLITIPRATGFAPVTWAVPGRYIAWRCRYEQCGTFKVTAVTADATNTYVATDQVGGFPVYNVTAIDTFYGASASALPVTRFSNCTGSADAVDLSQAGAYNKSLWSYSSRTYIGAAATPVIPMWGALVSLTFNGTVAYGGASSINFNIANPFVIQGTTADAVWNPTINPKNPGGTPHTVVATPPTVTGTQTGDSVSAPGATWFVSNQIIPGYSSVPGDIGSTSVTITIQTNQGIP